jgi:hypothetical protein
MTKRPAIMREDGNKAGASAGAHGLCCSPEAHQQAASLFASLGFRKLVIAHIRMKAIRHARVLSHIGTRLRSFSPPAMHRCMHACSARRYGRRLAGLFERESLIPDITPPNSRQASRFAEHRCTDASIAGGNGSEDRKGCKVRAARPGGRLSCNEA